MISDQIKNVKMQMNYYFGDYNYDKDWHMNRIKDIDGYIDLDEILSWPQMKNEFRATK